MGKVKINNEFRDLVDNFFFEEMDSYSENSKKSYRSAINHFGRFIKYNLDFNSNDILKYFNSDYFNKSNVTTQNLYKRHLKKYFRWKGIEEDFLAKIKKKREIKKVFRKEELLSPEDIRLMIENTDNLQYKCLIIVLYETAGREDEIRNIKIGDITQYDSYNTIFLSKTKTLQRNLPVIQSIPYINQWLNNHPQKNDNNSPFFGRKYSGEFKEYSRTGIYLIIKKKSAFLKKKVYPHLFRHSRLTELAKHLTDAELCRFAGWVIGSKQIRRYIHLVSEDVENKILSIHGITKKEELEQKSVIEVVKCPRCTYTNSSLDSFCSRCGCALSVKTLMKHEIKAAELERLIEKSDFKKYVDELFEKKFQELKR